MKMSPRTLYAFFLTAVLLVPAQYRLFSAKADVRADRIVLALLLAAWILGVLGAPEGPVPEARRRTGVPLLGFIGVALLSLLLNAPRTAPIGYLRRDIKSLLFLCILIATYFLALKLLRGPEDANRLSMLVVALGAIAAVTGVIERLGGANPIASWLAALPGVTQTRLDPVLERGERLRVMGTAEHPIAFGGLMAILLPPALHFALSSKGWKRVAFSVASALIATAMFFSVSRSAVLAAAAAFVVLLGAWPAQRRALIALAVALLLLVSVVDPGVLGTLGEAMRPAHVVAQERASHSSRLEDYPRVAAIVPRQPLFGVGWAAFDPSRYFYLDNQIFKTVLEVGVAGFLMALLFFMRVARLLWRSARSSGAPTSLEGALLASMVAFAVLSLLFDTFGFSQITYVFFAFAAFGIAAAVPLPETVPAAGSREEDVAS